MKMVKSRRILLVLVFIALVLVLMCGMAKSQVTWSSVLSEEDIAEMKTHYTYQVQSGALKGYTLEINSTTGKDPMLNPKSGVREDGMEMLWQEYQKVSSKSGEKLTSQAFYNQLVLDKTESWNWK